MENLDEQILDQTTEEEEIENEIIVTDEYNTELDIRVHWQQICKCNWGETRFS